MIPLLYPEQNKALDWKVLRGRMKYEPGVVVLLERETAEAVFAMKNARRCMLSIHRAILGIG
jgi:hypothetical protein